MDGNAQPDDSPTRTCPRCGRTTTSQAIRCVLCRKRLPAFGARPPQVHLDVVFGIVLVIVTAVITLTVLSPFLLAFVFDPFRSGNGWGFFIIGLVVCWLWGPPWIFVRRDSLNPATEEPYYSRCRWRLYWQAQLGTLAVTLGLFLLLFTVCAVMFSSGFH